ncbi:MAG: tRNA (adenosine(37)-N6)-threonylcarbamoyltransferase complex dimerization subunit type 1 TsaB [Ignavibacteriales bacterium]|nr:tRNA (adenosine(37)-N6)-threonylcarbamoyltransferase complex dimerization subunit type 1 TsaB [Ignavibacteriales bacterium]
MTILGLETSTAVCSVGLFREKKPGIEMSLRESHIHSEKLLTLVQEVLRAGETTLQQLDAIAVSIGPGSFTGLRIGLSTAKGLSFALEKPVIAVLTFEAIAEAGRQKHPGVSSVLVLMDAKKDEWYVGGFIVTGEKMEESGGVEIKDLGEALSAAKSSTLVLTDSVEVVRQQLKENVVVEDALLCCRGDIVALLGYRKAVKKEFADVAGLEPMYLKDFVVRTAVPVS